MELKDLINSAKLNILSFVRCSTIESTEWKGIWEGAGSRDARGALWNIGCSVNQCMRTHTQTHLEWEKGCVTIKLLSGKTTYHVLYSLGAFNI